MTEMTQNNIIMKKRFSVVEKDGRFHLYEDGQEYVTPCFFPISSCDKGLVEAVARKLGEGKPNLVMLYLRKYDNAELVKIIKDLASVDTYSGWYNITNNSKLCAEVFKNIQLRRLIDAYSACGSMGLVTNIAARDVEEDYDDFFPGMAVTSGIYASPYDDEADFLYDMLCDHFEDQYDMDVSETLSTDYLADFVMKYNAILVPKGERARRRFSDLLDQLKLESDPEDDNETSEEEEDND